MRRIECSELFGSPETLAGLPQDQIDRLVALRATDVGTNHGRYGDTVTYAWSTRFPERIGPETRGILAQGHGRPDRRTGERTGGRVDAAAGGPIGEFRIGFDHLYLMVRSDAARRSSPDDKLKTQPTNEPGFRTVEGTKEASLIWKMPLTEVPIGEWMDFKVRIR